MGRLDPFQTQRRPSRAARRQVDAWRRMAESQPGAKGFGMPALLGSAVMLGLAVGAAMTVDWSSIPTSPRQHAAAPAPQAFGLCHVGGGTNCVVDGDTVWIAGTKIRLADIDAPETHPSRCAEEARLGKAATLRLQALMSAGPFTLEAADRDTDRYGRALRIVMRDGQSLGGTLVAEGLARPWGGSRQPWC